ncbi:MAG: hypothetical protein MUF49_14150 [Oculatellaceae cyanobacterium Prado106]|nr:hypothetical protein [Oculatellaceae cyanobacterium Prado106]
MATQKLPLPAIQQIRQYVKGTIALTEPDSKFQSWALLDELEDIPEPESLDDLSHVFGFGSLSTEAIAPPSLTNPWSISTVNPAAALQKLPGLKLKPGFRMVCYLYRSKANLPKADPSKTDGAGLVWAVPEAQSTTAALEKALSKSVDLTQPPKPEGALPHFMEAIEGDRTPVSFIAAAMLRRELEEFGAVGQRCNWSHHRLIDAIPPQVQWQWGTPNPPDLTPKIKLMPDNQAALEFFTCRITHPIGIFRHLEIYPSHSYYPQSQSRPIAVAQK